MLDFLHGSNSVHKWQVTVSYNFVEPKAVVLTQDVYMAPNSITADWCERQLHRQRFCMHETNEQCPVLCAPPHISSSQSQKRDQIVLKSGRQLSGRQLSGLGKEAPSLDYTRSLILLSSTSTQEHSQGGARAPVLPHSLLCLYSHCWESRGISSNKLGQGKKKTTKVPISLEWFINYGSKIFI